MTNRTFQPILAVVFSLLMAVVLVTAAAAAPDPFLGTWHSTDTDGSHQTLRIGGGPGSMYRVRYFDDGASVCGWSLLTGGPAASAQGFLTGSGDVLSGEMPVTCLATPHYLFGPAAFAFTYDPGTNTLLDSHGVTWTR